MWTLSSHGIILIRIRDFRGEEEVDYYGAHVFLCDQKGGEKKSTRTRRFEGASAHKNLSSDQNKIDHKSHAVCGRLL